VACSRFAAALSLRREVGSAAHQSRARIQCATTCACGVPLYTGARCSQVGNRTAVAEGLGGSACWSRWNVNRSRNREARGGFAAAKGLAGIVSSAADQSRTRIQSVTTRACGVPLYTGACSSQTRNRSAVAEGLGYASGGGCGGGDGSCYRKARSRLATAQGLAGVVSGAAHQSRTRAQRATTGACGVPLDAGACGGQIRHRSVVAKRLGRTS
jgi:hypothetical protein